METGVLTSELSTVDKITFQIWDGRSEVPEYLDFFIICGAGILDLSFARGKPVINAHPGIIPGVRGLDAFKWAIYRNQPLGVTLHFAEAEVDKGKLIHIQNTFIYSSDSIKSLARRHYENEITLLGKIPAIINQTTRSPLNEDSARKKMPLEKEIKTLELFDSYKKSMITGGTF